MQVSEERGIIAAEGTASNQETWTLLYRPDGGKHCLEFSVNGGEPEVASGFDIPEMTEIGFAGGLTPGRGHLYLYGIVTSRVHVVRAESREKATRSDVATAALPSVESDGVCALRIFVLVRPPVDDVTALVGLDRDERVVQRIVLPGPAGQS